MNNQLNAIFSQLVPALLQGHITEEDMKVMEEMERWKQTLQPKSVNRLP